jgi:hypothetical protein
MPTVIISATVRVAFNALWSGTIPVTTIDYWRVVPDAGVISRADFVPIFAQVVSDAWETAILPNTSNNYVLQNMNYLDMYADDGVSGTLAMSGAGALSQSSEPPGICRIVDKIAPGSRSQRNGRYFLPGGSELQLNEDGNWDAGVATATAAAIVAYTNAVKAYTTNQLGAPEHVLASWARRQPNGDPWPPGTIVNGSARVITGYFGRVTYGSQRDRRPS